MIKIKSAVGTLVLNIDNKVYKNMRIRDRISQKKLGEMSGLGQRQVSHLLRGDTPINTFNCRHRKLLEVLLSMEQKIEILIKE